MKNIINWTLGGFFRTFGRILCFLVIGGLISLLLFKSGLKLPTWLQPLYVVKADTLYNWTTQQARIQTTHDGTDTWTSWENISGDSSKVYEPTYPVKSIAYHLKTSRGMNKNYTYKFRFNYKPTPDSLHIESYYFENSTTGDRENVTCVQNMSSAGFYWFECNFSPVVSYSADDYLYVKLNFYQSYLTDLRVGVRGYEELIGVNQVITEQTDNIITSQNQNTQEIINNINTANENLLNGITESNMVCKNYDITQINKNNYFLLPTGEESSNNNYGIIEYLKIDKNTKIYVKIPRSESNGSYYCFYNINKQKISCDTTYTKSENELITIPNNADYISITIDKNLNKPQFTICQNGNQAITDILSDNDTTEDSNNAANFFHNFNLSLEGPVSQIVLLPINLLQYLLVDYNSTDVHPPLCTTLKGQQVCLPSGDIIWKRSGCHDNLSPFGCPNFSQFRSFMQLVVGGFIYYKLLRRLVKAVEKGLDPQESGVNLMKL